MQVQLKKALKLNDKSKSAKLKEEKNKIMEKMKEEEKKMEQ